MPSKGSKKHSKIASYSSISSPLSSSSSFSPFNNQNPDAEIYEEDHLSALEEASRKFPSLISKTAFIGKVYNDATSSNSSSIAMEALDSKGCKIWMSESSMIASSIAPASLVSVSLASSRKLSSQYPLCSLADECAMNFGFDFTEKLVDDVGCYFSLATVFPSSKLLKNAVRLSSNLMLTMGCPASGQTLYVNPILDQPAMGFNECGKLHSSDDCSLSLYSCNELNLFLVSSQSTSTLSTMSSDIGLLTEKTNIRDEISKISSPKTPVFPQLKLKSPSSGRVSTPNFEGSRSDPSHLQETSEDTFDMRNILEDVNVRKLLQTCCASWLFSQHLLCGNFVSIPILSRLCIFQVIYASSLSIESKNLSEKSNCNFAAGKLDCNQDAYFVDHGTKVSICLPRHSAPENLLKRTSPWLEPVHGNSTAKVAVDLPKLGGLSEEYAVLKDIIVTSAVRCNLTSLGLRPTKGVLLHGPPGTGKTSLVTLCAHKVGVNLFSVNGPEVISQYYGESERALHEIFDAASKAVPAVVFIDELDAIAPARKDGGEELSQRMVATLLNLMDGIARTDGLVIIAATNRPDSVDPALRRPGRLDREIEIGVPSPKQRLQILLVLLSEIENSLSELDVQHLATATHGFVGADLAALCNEAALICLRQYVDLSVSRGGSECEPLKHMRGNSSNGVTRSCCDLLENNLDDLSPSIANLHISAKDADGVEGGGTCVTGTPDLRVTFEDFEKARMKVRPSAMREVVLEVPKVSWEDVGGQREVKMQLMEAVEWPQKHHDAFKRIGTQPPTGVLMFGPPGCSKTLLARAVASEAGLNFLAVKGPELFSKWVGESEKAVRSLFAKARANAPSIIFFDEIDGLAVIRGKESDGVSVSDRVLSQLLVELDGLHERINVTVIAATNRPDKVDSALLRPGRFDRLLYVGPPDINDRQEIFRVHLHKMPCSSDVSTKELALLTEGYTGADISLICREAAIAAIEENFHATEVTMQHLKAGIMQVQPSDILCYEEVSNKFQRLVHSNAEDV
ncbi:hypothetical protein ACH5RR_003176 [Cinchona calisaya]|uniref:AAA+ ATPase domain-containing protein n=1 Tax=Cinchona calisaya TaxID=153742 RepID=A0ABD3AU11_9GENT